MLLPALVLYFYVIISARNSLNHTELAVYAHRCGTNLSEAQVERLLYSSEGVRGLSESADTF